MGVALIKPLTPLHLGEATGALERISEIIHADTLFSAICHAWGHLYGKEETDKMLAGFTSSETTEGRPFKLSSCFPYIESGGNGEKRVYYLPAPHNLKDSFSRDVKKELNNISFLDLETYRKWTEGKLGDGDIESIKESNRSMKAEMGTKVNVHVTLDRPTLAGVPYYVSRLHCSPTCGFYFLFSCSDEYSERFRGALRLLGDMGIGGERSTGCGAFKVEFLEEEALSFEHAGSNGAWMSLSLVFPTQNDLARMGGAQIRLRERKGWISSPFTTESYRRKRVFMIEEGSIFKQKVEGRLVDVTPNIWNSELHPVYRYGFAWLIPARSGD